MKYALTLTVEDNEAGLGPEREKLVLWAHPSELPWHIGLKVIAYVIHMEHSPLVELSVGFRFKPDLAVVDDTGRVRLWIDCGNIAVKKVRRVAGWLQSGARFVVLRREERDGLALVEAIQADGPLRHRLEVLWFDDGFADGFAEALDASNTLACVRTARRIDMTLTNRGGEFSLRSRLHRRVLGPEA
ncbi:MAG: YaeQ family protein [Oceanidesulfovibrio sp.]